MPEIVVMGMAALRSTWRQISCRRGMPRLTAVWTCSRPSLLTDRGPVTRATIASEESASAIAGRVR